MRLQTKISLILVVTVVLALGGSGLFFLHSFEKAFMSSVFQSLDLITRTNAQSIADYLRMQRVTVNHIGMMFPREALRKRDFERIEGFFAKLSNDFPAFANGFFFLDEAGILRADYPPHPDKRHKSYAFRPYFQRTMGERSDQVAAPYRSIRSGAPVLTFTAYIESDDGKPLGVIGCSTNLLEDSDLGRVRKQKIGDSGYSYVFDKSRLMILHPDDERALSRDVPVGANKMFDAAIAGFEGTTETINSKGVAMFVAFRPVAGTDWIIGGQQPVAEALAPLQESQRTLILFVLFGSVLAVVGGMLLVHRTMRDLVLLEAVTAGLAIPAKGRNDIGAMLQAEAGKLAPLANHVEFGPLASTIGGLYQRLGRALAETQQMATELDDAYRKLQTTQSQILQQEKMASIGQLAAGVAHEINNPMGYISSNLITLGRYFERLMLYLSQLEEWLLQFDDATLTGEFNDLKKKLKIAYLREDIPDLLSESNSGAVRVRDIVQNLKSFSRVDQTEFSEVSINDCLESSIAIGWNEIKYKATLEREYGQLPPLNCYPQQLNQVFLNLLVNAAQAINANGVIKVKTWAEDGQVKITISDDGCGIPETIQGRIFEPFFTTKKVGEGTGLGMSISYDIVTRHGGDILLESTEGQGTTFTIMLPYSGESGRNG